MQGVIVDVDALRPCVGRRFGPSSWHLVPQAQIDQFAEATGDRQWLHADGELAKSGPFGGPIAHGFLTLALFTVLLDEVLQVRRAARTINYGLNRVRFPAPVPAGVRVRLHVTIDAVEEIDGGVQVTYGGVVEREGSTKPCCVMDVLFRYYYDYEARSA
jgi:acyl dehydratase